MAFPWVPVAVGGGLLLLLAGTSWGGTPPPVVRPPPPPPPPPSPNRGPNPPPWPGLRTATVNVPGFPGIVTHTRPSVSSPRLPGDGGTFNGTKVALLEENVPDEGGQPARQWARVYTPTGFTGYVSTVDPQGVRNVTPDTPLPQGIMPNVAGLGWAPYAYPRVGQALPPPPVPPAGYGYQVQPQGLNPVRPPLPTCDPNDTRNRQITAARFAEVQRRRQAAAAAQPGMTAFRPRQRAY